MQTFDLQELAVPAPYPGPSEISEELGRRLGEWRLSQDLITAASVVELSLLEIKYMRAFERLGQFCVPIPAQLAFCEGKQVRFFAARDTQARSQLHKSFRK
jgi:hypothetical protein